MRILFPVHGHAPCEGIPRRTGTHRTLGKVTRSGSIKKARGQTLRWPTRWRLPEALWRSGKPSGRRAPQRPKHELNPEGPRKTPAGSNTGPPRARKTPYHHGLACLMFTPKASCRFPRLLASDGNRHPQPRPTQQRDRQTSSAPKVAPVHDLSQTTSLGSVCRRAGLLTHGSPYSPRLPGICSQWHPVGFVPVHSGGSATASNRFPCFPCGRPDGRLFSFSARRRGRSPAPPLLNNSNIPKDQNPVKSSLPGENTRGEDSWARR